jgi:hypothetical protein
MSLVSKPITPADDSLTCDLPIGLQPAGDSCVESVDGLLADCPSAGIRLPATRRSLHALQSIPAIILLVSNPLATPVLSPLTAYLLTAHPLAIRLPATRRSLHALQSIPAITLLSDLESMTPAEIIFAQC